MRLISSSRTVDLPNYARDGYQKLITPNTAKNITLSGKLYVDFFNNRGGHKFTYDTLTADEYNDLRAIWQDQFTNEEFLTFDPTGLSGDYQSVFLSLPAESNVVWDQAAVLGLVITLEPEDADS